MPWPARFRANAFNAWDPGVSYAVSLWLFPHKLEGDTALRRSRPRSAVRRIMQPVVLVYLGGRLRLFNRGPPFCVRIVSRGVTITFYFR